MSNFWPRRTFLESQICYYTMETWINQSIVKYRGYNHSAHSITHSGPHKTIIIQNLSRNHVRSILYGEHNISCTYIYFFSFTSLKGVGRKNSQEHVLRRRNLVGPTTSPLFFFLFFFLGKLLFLLLPIWFINLLRKKII
jgi:hypothetical protein